MDLANQTFESIHEQRGHAGPVADRDRTNAV
jgi:hypothetical protein